MLDVASLLCKRGLSYLDIAETAFNKGYYDVASTNCEISAELLVKSTFIKLGITYPPLHQVRRLLSQLSFFLPEFKDEINQLVKNKRREFLVIELSRSNGQHSPIEVSPETALTCIKTVKESLLPLLRKIWRDEWCLKS